MREHRQYWKLLAAAAVVASLVTLILTTKSLLDFTRTGPEIRGEILDSYSGYAALAMLRLAAWTWLISFALASVGSVIHLARCQGRGRPARFWPALIWAGLAWGIITGAVFLHLLLYNPSGIIASFLYDPARLYPVWGLLTPTRLTLLKSLIIALLGLALLSGIMAGRRRGAVGTTRFLTAYAIAGAALYLGLNYHPEPVTQGLQAGTRSPRMNLLMIGSDTLRADRFSVTGYERELTPYIDDLAREGTFFTQAYVPVARTAPSLASMLTGAWPQHTGIRSNYIGDADARLPVTGLPELLNAVGYQTAAIGDWAGGDLAKLSLGYRETDLPEDQWNLRFLIRQGPKDIRLFLSLFAHNPLGKRLLPEIYYLAGFPIYTEITYRAKQLLSEYAADSRPFHLNVFMGVTHAPFSAEYPYYSMFAAKDYYGDSKFALSGLTDPSSIVKRQQQGKEAFDIQQVIDLYDGAVRSFDDQVRAIVTHLESLGLRRNTLIVIYSDHGTELFERHTWGQGNSMVGDDPSARIPLLILDPRYRDGRVVRRTVRSVDLMPTLLELLELPVPESVDGVSLAGYLQQPDFTTDLPAFHETGVWLGQIPGLQDNHLQYPPLLEILEVPDKATGTLALKPDYRDRVIQAKDRMIRTDKWKLVYLPMRDGAEYWLFDIENDPLCYDNVIDDYPDVAARLKQELIEWMSLEPGMEWDGQLLQPRAAAVDGAKG